MSCSNCTKLFLFQTLEAGNVLISTCNVINPNLAKANIQLCCNYAKTIVEVGNEYFIILMTVLKKFIKYFTSYTLICVPF